MSNSSSSKVVVGDDDENQNLNNDNDNDDFMASDAKDFDPQQMKMKKSTLWLTTLTQVLIVGGTIASVLYLREQLLNRALNQNESNKTGGSGGSSLDHPVLSRLLSVNGVSGGVNGVGDHGDDMTMMMMGGGVENYSKFMELGAESEEIGRAHV